MSLFCTFFCEEEQCPHDMSISLIGGSNSGPLWLCVFKMRRLLLQSVWVALLKEILLLNHSPLLYSFVFWLVHSSTSALQTLFSDQDSSWCEFRSDSLDLCSLFHRRLKTRFIFYSHSDNKRQLWSHRADPDEKPGLLAEIWHKTEDFRRVRPTRTFFVDVTFYEIEHSAQLKWSEGHLSDSTESWPQG